MSILGVKKKKRHVTAYFPVILFLFVLCVFTTCFNSFSLSSTKHEKEILKAALNRSITQCYALEGCYPYEISYLEDYYGLTYNKKRYFIDYQYIGGNLRPDITIIERK